MGIWEGAQRFLGKRRRTSHRQQNIKGGTIKSNFHSTASEWGIIGTLQNLKVLKGDQENINHDPTKILQPLPPPFPVPKNL